MAYDTKRREQHLSGLGLAILLGITACGSCGTQQPPPDQQATTSQPTTTVAPRTTAPPVTVRLPDYEIFDDSVDSSGMRLVFIGTADGFSAAEQRAIVEDVMKDEIGKNRWTRVFVRPNSNRSAVQRGECLEAFNGQPILNCDFSR